MRPMRFQTLTLNVVDEGPRTGPTVVFANSLGTDFRIWDGVVDRLPDGWRRIRYDKRGHGLSDCPPPPYTIGDHVGDLLSILDGLAVDRAVVVGLSVGGLIALGLAGSAPDRVRGLVLADTAAKIGSSELWDQRIAAIQVGGIAAVADGVLERWFPPPFWTQRPADLALWRNMLTRSPADGYIGTAAAIRDADFTVEARAIAVPTVCIVGSEDGSTPPDVVRATADLIPGARFHVIDGSGHVPCIDQPDRFAGILVPFLEEVDRDR